MGKKPAKSSERAMMPNAVIISTVDGQELTVPSNKEENSFANQVVIAQIRQQINRNLKLYREREELMTPKELKDMAEAAAVLIKSSAEIYQNADPLQNKTESTEVKADEVSFEELKQDADNGRKENPQPAVGEQVAGGG
jgi:hypothetical protein